MKTLNVFLIVSIIIGVTGHLSPIKGATRHPYPKDSVEVKALVDELHEASDLNTKSYILEDLVSVSTNAIELKPIYRKLLDDKDRNVQEAALRVAAKMKMKDTIPKIREILKKQPRYKLTLKRRITSFRQAEDMGYTCEAAKALIALGDFDSVDEIISRDLFMNNAGGQFLAEFGVKVLPKVLQHAKDGEIQQLGARGTISFMRDEAAVPELIKLLNGPDSFFAGDAARALSEIANATKSSELKSEIIKQLEEQFASNNDDVKIGVYGGLLAANPEKYRAQVFAALAKDNGMVQLYVMDDLSRKRVKGLGPFLKQFIKDDEAINPIFHDNRAAAARALYLTTGEKVQYKGLEEDQKKPSSVYSDPYAKPPAER